MIKIDSTQGELNCNGPLDHLLCEYTLLTRVILKALKSNFGEELANKILAELGRIAVKDVDEVHNVTKLYEDVDEVLDNEI